MVAFKPKASPSFRLFWNDVKPILLKLAADTAKFAAVGAVAILASPEFRAIVAAHFGVVGGSLLAALLVVVTGQRFVKDNAKAVK